MGFAAALVASALSWAVFTESWSGLGRVVATALFYVVPMMALQVAFERPLRVATERARFPFDWIVFTGGQLGVVALAAAIASALMLLTGFAEWRYLLLVNRIVILFAVTVSCAARLFFVTKGRLEEKARLLEEKSAADRRELRDQQQDFERAREIQEALVPKKLPKLSGCDLAAGWQPARMVGGDYFDVIPLGDSAVALAIGDVVGKGMGAALLMSNLQAIVRSFAASAPSAAELCAKANQLVAANIAPGKFITFFFAVADVGKGRLDYCSAGHNPPVLLRRSGKVERLGEGGPVLGVFPRAVYSGGGTPLQAGDCLLMYTDGITEAMNRDGEEFGEERLLATLQQCDGSPADEVRQRVMAAVTEFSEGTFQDDATLLILRLS